MEQQVLTQLSKFLTFLHATYQETSISCQILSKNCLHHHNVLKTWFLPVEVKCYECTCESQFEEPEYLAKDITNVVERAKIARKTLNSNMKVQFIDYGKISNDPKKSLGFRTEIRSSSNLKSGKVVNQMNASRGKNSVDGKDRIVPNSKAQFLSLKGGNTKFNKVRSFQTTYQSDFFKRSSRLLLNTSKCTRKNSVKKAMGNPTGTTLSEFEINGAFESLSESLGTNEEINLKNTFTNNSCIVHGDDRLSQKSSKLVELKEAMEVLGVPTGLLQLLKTYHQYVNKSSKFNVKDVKARSSESFLQKLITHNQISWETTTTEPVMRLCLHYLSVFVEVLCNNYGLNSTLLDELDVEFNLLMNNFQILANDTSIEYALCNKNESSLMKNDTFNKINWSVIGIWNENCWDVFLGFNTALKISYASKEDCTLFFKKMHGIQKLKFQIQVLDILQTDVFPLLNMFNDGYVYLSPLYKSCSTLCNLSSLSVPILLRKNQIIC